MLLFSFPRTVGFARHLVRRCMHFNRALIHWVVVEILLQHNQQQHVRQSAQSRISLRRQACGAVTGGRRTVFMGTRFLLWRHIQTLSIVSLPRWTLLAGLALS